MQLKQSIIGLDLKYSNLESSFIFNINYIINDIQKYSQNFHNSFFV